MIRYEIEGGRRLYGQVRVGGSKNAALPILCAALLNEGETVLHHCPDISDVAQCCALLKSLGCQVQRQGETVVVDAKDAFQAPLCDEMTGGMRASVLFLGPLLGRFYKATLGKPGGCAIGKRPIDYHLLAAEALGAKCWEEDGCICLDGADMKAGTVVLPFPSVGATENAICLGAALPGLTVIKGAAREPEIYDLQQFLRAMGIQIHGAGSNEIYVEGKRLHTPVSYSVMPDRIEAGTLMAAAAATGGKVFLEDCDWMTMMGILPFFANCGCQMKVKGRQLCCKAPKRLRCCPFLLTKTYPGFPTDMQPLAAALLTTAKGTSMIMEQIFENRFHHCLELNKMGGRIGCSGKVAVIEGVKRLHGSRVSATDLRAGAALMVAALGAEGRTEVENGQYVCRGYAGLEEKLAALGGRVRLMESR